MLALTVMKKIKLTSFSVLILLLFLLSPLVSIVHGFSQTSQTFELGQGVYSGIADFDLQVGDHVEGSFSVGNLGPYQRLFGSGTSYEVVDVWIIGPSGHPPNGNSILNVSATPSENTFNFNFTAQEQGTYHMWAFSGAMDYLQNAKNPVMTLSYEWTGTPMKVYILSPSNQIYAESNVSLTYTINRPSDWASYSLDGAKNVTLWDSHNGNPETANTTLTGLAIGVHSLTLYSNDSWGNMDSKTITFTVEKSENRLFGSTNTIAVTAILVTIVCVIIGILLLRRHRKLFSLSN